MTTPDITVMVIGPGRKVEVLVVTRDYREFNRLVNGSISMLRLPQELRDKGYAAYCNDDAVAMGEPPNGFAEHLGHWRLLGAVVFFGDHGDGDEHSLTVAEVRALGSYISHHPTEEAREQAEYDRAFWAEHPSGMVFRSYDTLEELLEDAGL